MTIFDEDWSYQPGGSYSDNFELLCDESEVFAWVSPTEGPARATLVAAALGLYRALKAVEWGGDAEWCDACKSHPPKHGRDCVTDAALRKAEGRR